MRDDDFEWDDRKAATNWRKHGFAFEDARAVFADPKGFERPDLDETSEDRFLLTGFAGDLLVTVVFVQRSHRYRIISARKASPNEQREYFTQNF